MNQFVWKSKNPDSLYVCNKFDCQSTPKLKEPAIIDFKNMHIYLWA